MSTAALARENVVRTVAEASGIGNVRETVARSLGQELHVRLKELITVRGVHVRAV
jgi:hypothetical protein